MTGPQDPAAAGCDRLRAGHADREQVIETLKDAFVQGRLTREELDARAGQALAARTCADLAALTADIPAAPAAAGAPARPGPPVAAGQGGRRVGRLPGHRGRRRVGRHPRRSGPPRPQSRSLLGSPDASHRPCRRTGGTRHPGRTGWSPHGSRDAPAGGCRPGRDRVATPWTADGAAAPAMARFPPAPAPTRPAPTCGLTSHRSTGSTFPRGRAGHPWRAAGARRGLTPANRHRDRCLPGCPGWA